MTTAEKTVKYFTERGFTVSFAESCTGGLITKLITDVSGASAVLKGGVCAYSNEIKMRVLGVDPAVLKAHGAVSAETAVRMACGVQELMDTDVAIATTGIAGPKSDDTLKPVGLVYVAAATAQGRVVVEKLNLDGTRDEIRMATAEKALELALKTATDM